MDLVTARALIELNNRFYADHAASFSATRDAAWDGWHGLVEILRRRGWGRGAEAGARVLDLACGNLRFERFLNDALPEVEAVFHAVDACAELAGDGAAAPHVVFHRADVLQELLERKGAQRDTGTATLEGVPPCELSASFGFMHHVPGREMRRSIIDLLVDRTVPGGLIIVSFWQFMHDERLARKALTADEAMRARAPELAARLDPDDHFLGWQSDTTPLRYCHHFDETEIDGLVASVGTGAREIARYSADGASGTLNRYLVLERSA